MTAHFIQNIVMAIGAKRNINAYYVILFRKIK
jgi:hypothetical protein